jgi:hypothetical protein
VSGFPAIHAHQRKYFRKVEYRFSEGKHGDPPLGSYAQDRGAPVREYVSREQNSRLMRKADDGGAGGQPGVPKGAGASLPSSVRAKMEPRLGADLSGVRIHTGGESAKAAQGFGARAFTVGSDVHFNAGEFSPGTKEGDKLLAHELTHVVQGQKSGVQRKADDGDHGAEAKGDAKDDAKVSDPSEPAEQEADAVSEKVAGDLHDDNKGDKKDKNGKKGDEKKAAADEKAGDEKGAEKGADKKDAAAKGDAKKDKGGDEKKAAAGDKKAEAEGSSAAEKAAGDEKKDEEANVSQAAPAVGRKIAITATPSAGIHLATESSSSSSSSTASPSGAAGAAGAASSAASTTEPGAPASKTVMDADLATVETKTATAWCTAEALGIGQAAAKLTFWKGKGKVVNDERGYWRAQSKIGTYAENPKDRENVEKVAKERADAAKDKWAADVTPSPQHIQSDLKSDSNPITHGYNGTAKLNDAHKKAIDYLTSAAKIQALATAGGNKVNIADAEAAVRAEHASFFAGGNDVAADVKKHAEGRIRPGGPLKDKVNLIAFQSAADGGTINIPKKAGEHTLYKPKAGTLKRTPPAGVNAQNQYVVEYEGYNNARFSVTMDDRDCPVIVEGKGLQLL